MRTSSGKRMPSACSVLAMASGVAGGLSPFSVFGAFAASHDSMRCQVSSMVLGVLE